MLAKPKNDTGAASAVLTTAQQIGGSFGTAIQNTIFVSTATSFAASLVVKLHHEKIAMTAAAFAVIRSYRFCSSDSLPRMSDSILSVRILRARNRLSA